MFDGLDGLGLHLNRHPSGRLTLFVRLDSSGLASSTALMATWLFICLWMISDRLSRCTRALTQSSSTASSEIFLTTAGDMLISSTAGPNNCSTNLRFSSMVFRTLDRDCNVSISAETTARSVWKLMREASTDLRTLSQP